MKKTFWGTMDGAKKFNLAVYRDLDKYGRPNSNLVQRVTERILPRCSDECERGDCCSYLEVEELDDCYFAFEDNTISYYCSKIGAYKRAVDADLLRKIENI